MSDQFLLPDLGEGLTEAEIVNWLVAEGDVIAIDQPVVEVESAKSVVELPSPYGGRITRLHAAAGESVERGAPLFTVDGAATGDGAGSGGTAPADASAEVPAPAVPSSGSAEDAPASTDSPQELVPGTALREEDDDAGSGAVLVGYGTKETAVSVRKPSGRFGRSIPADRTAADPAAPPSGAGAGTTAGTALLDPARRSPVASPIVRRLAREHGIDASALAGSGPGSVVQRSDVEAAISALAQDGARDPLRGTMDQAAAQQPPQPAQQQAAAQPAADQPAGDGDTRTAITGMRKLIGTRLAHSRRVIPEATIWLDADVTELFTAKARLEQATGERFGLTALVARFVVAALEQYPVLNSSVDDDAGEIVQHPSVHLGLAAQTRRGLMVPVVRDADRMSMRQLRDAVGALVSRADTGDYAAAEVSGSTFTVNNYGGFGVDGSAPIINHPEVAMLGVGRIIDRPWVVDGALAIRKVAVLSFVFDHRVCDGDVAAGFLTTVTGYMREPLLLLADG